MYTITLKAPTLTGETVHTLVTDDKSLFDTWGPITLGNISDELKTHDASCNYDYNICCEPNERGHDELTITFYPYFIDPDNKEHPIQTDHGKWESGVILSVKSDEPKEPAPDPETDYLADALEELSRICEGIINDTQRERAKDLNNFIWNECERMGVL